MGSPRIAFAWRRLNIMSVEVGRYRLRDMKEPYALKARSVSGIQNETQALVVLSNLDLQGFLCHSVMPTILALPSAVNREPSSFSPTSPSSLSLAVVEGFVVAQSYSQLHSSHDSVDGIPVGKIIRNCCCRPSFRSPAGHRQPSSQITGLCSIRSTDETLD